MAFMSSNRLFLNQMFYKQKLLYIISISRSMSLSLNQRNSHKSIVKEEKPVAGDSGSNENTTLVGPPHPVSNLRLKIFPNSKNLTPEEKYFYQKSQETQEWNQEYWECHNRDFTKSEEDYIKEITKREKGGTEYVPNMNEMAEFYRLFLNKNYEKHVTYNWQWYRKNLYLIYLSAKAQLSKLKKYSNKK